GGQYGLHRTVGAGIVSESPLGRRFHASRLVIPRQLDDTETRLESLLRIWACGQYLFYQPGGRLTSLAGPLDKPGRVPFGVKPVPWRHVLRKSGIAAFDAGPDVDRHALAFMECFH